MLDTDCMRVLVTAMVSASLLLGDPDARELVKKSLANYQHDWHASLNYSYVQRDVEMRSGKETISVREVTTIEGTPYERLVERDGRPLSPADQKREKDSFDRTVEQRRHETPAQREKRIADYDNQRSFLKEVPDALQFKLLGERLLNSRATFVVECTPNPNYQPHSIASRIFPKIEAKLFIDKQDLRWARAEANVMDTIAFGFVLARVAKGSKILLEQTRLNDQVWMPKRIEINGTARIMMLTNRDLTERITCSDHRLTKPIANDSPTHERSMQTTSNAVGIDHVQSASR